MKMRVIIIVLIGISSLTVYGQVTNTTHKDESNIYYHALDSAVKIILRNTRTTPETIYLEGEQNVINRTPESILGLKIIKKNNKQDKIKVKDGSATIKMYSLEVENGEFSIFITLWTNNNGQTRILDKGVSGYTFIYEYVASDKSFRFLGTDRGVIIR